MKAIAVAESMGVDLAHARRYLSECRDVVESKRFVATLKGNTVHVAGKFHGLGGRKLMRDCRETLRLWFALEPILYAPIKHANTRAIRFAMGMGFHPYAEDETYVWLVQTREKFNGH